MIKKIFPILALSIFSAMLGVGIIAPLLPLYAEDLGASSLWIGIIFASFSISRTIFMPLIGRLSDRNGRKPFLSLGLLFYSAISLGYIWAGSVPELAIIRFVHGAAAGTIIPIAQAYVGDISPQGEEGKWMGYFNASFFTGFGIGPLMGGVLTEHFGMTVAFSAMGALNLLAFFLVVLWLPEIKAKKLNKEERRRLPNPLSSNLVRGLFSFRLAFSVGRGILVSFLPIFGAAYAGLGPTHIGILITVVVLIMSVLQVLTGGIADKFNKRTLVILGSLVNVIFLTLIPLTHSFIPLLLLCILGGIGGALAMPAASALNVEEGRKFGMGSTLGAFAMAFSIGMAAGPLSAGLLADLTGLPSVFYLGAGAGLLGTGLLIWFTRSRQPLDKAEPIPYINGQSRGLK